MSKARLTKPFNVVAGVIFLAGIGILAYMGIYDWLPGLSLVVGLSVIIRQLLMGYKTDALIALIVFGATFLSSFMQFFARIFLPTFLMIGAVYYIIRQFFSFVRNVDSK